MNTYTGAACCMTPEWSKLAAAVLLKSIRSNVSKNHLPLLALSALISRNRAENQPTQIVEGKQGTPLLPRVGTVEPGIMSSSALTSNIDASGAKVRDTWTDTANHSRLTRVDGTTTSTHRKGQNPKQPAPSSHLSASGSPPKTLHSS
ncbi:unnamed protein product [Mesocestoides corti]|uniref:Uncharacterized protein n=1 Tax=Mesocestoides corti TaxID=53468 RepID=A0A0R3UBI0_MESCO|nr:unnamed protein product [Mesocestoides corti]